MFCVYSSWHVISHLAVGGLNVGLHVHSQLPVCCVKVNEDALNYLFNDRLSSRE